MKDGIKYHKILLETIENFKENSEGTLISKKKIFNGLSTKFKPQKHDFDIEFEYDIFSKDRKILDVGKSYRGIQIQFGKAVYNLESVHLGQHSPPRMTGSIDRIHTIGFSESQKYYYQLIIPLEKQLKFHFIIKETIFSTDLGYISRNGTRAIINGDSMNVCCIQNEKKKYFLVIDSTIKQTFNEFSEKAQAIQIGLGYLTGYFAGNQGFFFAHTKKEKQYPKHFRCVALRNSIKSLYTPIYSNAYGFLHRKKSLAKKYESLLRNISLDEFSILCEKIHTSLDFSSVLMLMLETSVSSLLFMPGGYAIALETISDLITGDTKQRLAPIKDRSLSKKIRKELLEVLDHYSTEIAPIDFNVLKTRIDQLNQITNKSRLKAPFELLNIDLLEEDLKILETRNDFLHGRVPDMTNAGKMRSTDRINKDLYYCSMRLYTLLNVIILKWIGYDNKVVNYPKINEEFTHIDLEEQPFRQV